MVHGGPMLKRYCWSMVHGPMAHGGPWWPLPWEKYCWFITWLRRRRQSGRPRCSCSLLPELNRLRCFWFVESESDFVHLCSCDDDLLLQLCDALHVLHVAKILQTGLDIKICSLKFQWHCNLMTLLEDLEDLRGNGRGYHSPQRLHTTVTWLQF